MSTAARPATPRMRIDEALARFTIPVLWRMFNLRGNPGSPRRSPFREDRSTSFSVSEEATRLIFWPRSKGSRRPKGLLSCSRWLMASFQALPQLARQKLRLKRVAGPQGRDQN
jgi:hypothetical protein